MGIRGEAVSEPRCNKCTDTGRYIVDEGYKGLTSYVCECQPGVNMCKENHVPITFSQFACPLCAAFIRIAWLESEIKKLHGFFRSDVQQMQDRAQLKKQQAKVEDAVPNT
jgi:hypothetical protein